MAEVSRQEYIQRMKKMKKTDLHSHAGRGGNKKYIEEYYGIKSANPPQYFSSLNHMQEWYVENIREIAPGKEGFLKRWEAAFKQADEDNIAIVALSFGVDEISVMGGMEPFVKLLTEMAKVYAPSTVFLPELSYLRGSNIDEAVEKMEEILSFHFFQSLDICGDEFAAPIEAFIPLYRKAEESGLKLKAHVGEFGTADDVMRACRNFAFIRGTSWDSGGEFTEYHGMACGQWNPVKYMSEQQCYAQNCAVLPGTSDC